jgi:two-component system chemotaxis response regulator CheB
MKPIRVLVVDDSDFARDLICEILSADREIVIAGTAVNGREAVEKVRDLKPDIVTMDIEMPVMDGLEAIERIMAASAVPILVVTSLHDANTAYAAIDKGALDLVVKPDVNLEEAQEFIKKIKLLSKIQVITHLGGKHAARKAHEAKTAPLPVFSRTASDWLVAIASSTGGPEALSVILSVLPSSFPCPVVIAQHNTDGFIPGMVEWLRGISKMTIRMAKEGDALVPGTVYVSPSERHMQITPDKRVAFIERHPKDRYRPSCDILLSSVASVYKANSLGVILTGMGSDGAGGMQQIKNAGGTTIAQDEKSSIVFGMPKVAFDSGCIDKVLPLDKIAEELLSVVAGRTHEKAGVPG